MSDGTESPPLFPFWSFRDDVYIEAEPRNDVLTVHSRWEDLSFTWPGRAVIEALRRMSLGPISLENIIGDAADRAELNDLLGRLQHLVVRSFGADPERPLISVVPLTQQARFDLGTVAPDQPVRLSRFALVRTDGSNYYVESPLALHRAILHRSDAVTLLASLGRPVAPSTLIAEAQPVIAYLLAAGLVVQAEGGDPFQPVRFAEDTDPALVTWTPLDLMFHARSTLGRHDYDFGATYPMGETWSVEPVVKLPSDGDGIPLDRPGWDDLLAADPPLTVALEGNAHTRHFGPDPLMARELGELLYRTARVRSLVGSKDERSTTSTSDRPYPCSGSCYELELYVAAANCAGIPHGIFHYDPFNHRLEPIEASPTEVDELVESGRMAANLDSAPAVLITITARFRRLSWKYNGLSYALVLKNAGILTQTLSLVSVAMGLAACRLDSADIDAAARVLGTDWRVESSVGGFVIGRRAEASRTRSSKLYGVNNPQWPERARSILP